MFRVRFLTRRGRQRKQVAPTTGRGSHKTSSTDRFELFFCIFRYHKTR
jgi:hypothetical protein